MIAAVVRARGLLVIGIFIWLLRRLGTTPDQADEKRPDATEEPHVDIDSDRSRVRVLRENGTKGFLGCSHGGRATPALRLKPLSHGNLQITMVGQEKLR